MLFSRLSFVNSSFRARVYPVIVASAEGTWRAEALPWNRYELSLPLLTDAAPILNVCSPFRLHISLKTV